MSINYSYNVIKNLLSCESLKISSFLNNLIQGKSGFDNIQNEIKTHYEKNQISLYKKADFCFLNICSYLNKNCFSNSINELCLINNFLNNNEQANECFRTNNICQKEWVIGNVEPTICDYKIIEKLLENLVIKIESIDYTKISTKNLCKILSEISSEYFLLMPFSSYSVLTFAVYLFQYFSSYGVNFDYRKFGENAWYFRNALVRANYSNVSKNIFKTQEFIYGFFEVILNEKNSGLKNGDLYIKTNAKTSSPIKISERQKSVYFLIKSDAKITAENIAFKCKVSLRTIKNDLSFLQDKKIIKRRKGKRYGHWLIMKEI